MNMVPGDSDKQSIGHRRGVLNPTFLVLSMKMLATMIGVAVL